MGEAEFTKADCKKSVLTFEEFVDLVDRMRHNQRRYAAFRRPEALATARKLEAEVDETIAVMKDRQMKLF